MPENQYTSARTKHHLSNPAVARAINLPCHGHVEIWPVYATGRHNATTTTKVVKNRRVKVVTLNDFERSFQPRPKFLAFLEAHIRKELQNRNITDSGPSASRLQVFRETFDYIIEAFTSYRPVLAQIKLEYEQMMKHYGDRITELEPMKEVLYFFEADCDQKVIGMRENEKEEYYKLLKINEALKGDIHSLKEEIEDLKHQINVLSETISELYSKLRDEQDARSVFMLTQRVDKKAEHANIAEVNKIRVDNDKLKITAAEAKKAHAEAVQHLMQMKIDYSDVVPNTEYEKIRNKNLDLKAEFETLTESLRKISSEKRETQLLYSAAVEQRDLYYMKLMRSKTGGGMPEWMVCAEYIATCLKNFKEFKNETSYFDLVDRILTEILLSGVETSEAGEDEEARKERQLEAIKESLGEDAIHGANLLSEMIASVLMGEGNAQDRRKSLVIARQQSRVVR